MGRKKKYITVEEQINARNNRRMKYYWLNHEKEKKQALKRYYENKCKLD